MKNLHQFLWLLLPTIMLSQNILIVAYTFSPEQLVKDIPICSDS
ncbi:MAG: hypothetical protein ABIO60_03300 [Aquaticitalea sp.]